MMDWRTWVYQQLIGEESITDEIPALRIFGSAALEGSLRTKPYMVIRLGTVSEGAHGDDVMAATYTGLELWVHDVPGSYLRIDRVLGVIRNLLDGKIPGGDGIMVRWQGDSAELADSSLDTIVRFGSYRLVGKV